MRYAHFWMLWLLCLAACATAPQPASIVQLGDAPLAALTPTPAVIFVTPTPQATLIPTVALLSPTPTATYTPSPSPTVDVGAQQAACDVVLEALYLAASEACLGEAGGYFCNGGAPPRTEPGGGVANGLANVGGLVAASDVNSIQTARLGAGNSGGVAYLHLREALELNVLLLGDVTFSDVALTAQGFSKWQSFTVRTSAQASDCPNAPRNSFFVQGMYGREARFVANGVSVALNGSLLIQTSDEGATHFALVEGFATLVVQGVMTDFTSGQQVDVPYPPNSFSVPSGPASLPRPLDAFRIANLPIVIFDRPVLLPQPGFVETAGTVNMRSEPNQNSQLLYQVPSGQRMNVLGKNSAGDWYHVRLGNGETGWMRADLLQASLGPIEVVYDATPLPPQRPGTLGNSGVVVAAQGGNLRVAPDTSFGIINTLTQGTQVELLARSAYSPFVKVRSPNGEGWVALIVLDTQAVINFLPIDYTAPLPPRPVATAVFEYGGGHAYPDPNSGQ